MRLFKKLFVHSPIHYAIASGIALVLFGIYWISTKFIWIYVPDALCIAGAITLLVGLLLLISHYGAFDTIAYSFTTFRKREKRKYTDLVDYSERKASQRKLRDLFFMPYIAIGTIILIIGIVLSFFAQPSKKLDNPTGINVTSSESQLIITWDKNELALNGYTVIISEYVDNQNIVDKPESKTYKVEQTNEQKVELKVDVTDLTKKYEIKISCNTVDKYNGSDYVTEIYDPSK